MSPSTPRRRCGCEALRSSVVARVPREGTTRISPAGGEVSPPGARQATLISTDPDLYTDDLTRPPTRPPAGLITRRRSCRPILYRSCSDPEYPGRLAAGVWAGRRGGCRGRGRDPIGDGWPACTRRGGRSVTGNGGRREDQPAETGGSGRVLTVSLLMAPAGGSGRRHACQARTPPPWATRCGGEARRTARPTRWAGAVGRAGEKASPPRRGMRGGEAQAGTLRLRAAALDRDTPLRPHRLGTAAQGEAVSLRGLKPSTAGAATAARLGRSPGHGDEPANCRRGPTTFTNPSSRAHNLAERTGPLR